MGVTKEAFRRLRNVSRGISSRLLFASCDGSLWVAAMALLVTIGTRVLLVTRLLVLLVTGLVTIGDDGITGEADCTGGLALVP